MISCSLMRRLERLETRRGINRKPPLQFAIQFVETDGTVVSTLLLEEGGRRAWLDREGRPCTDPRGQEAERRQRGFVQDRS